MPFLPGEAGNYKQCKKTISSLQVHSCLLYKALNPLLHKITVNAPKVAVKKQIAVTGKRVSHHISIKKVMKKGYMTVEAAMVIPLFLFVILNMFAAVNYIALHVRLQTAMHQTGLELVRAGYAYHKVAEGCEFLQSEIADIGFSVLYVKEKVISAAGEKFIDRIGIQGGSQGVSFIQSEVTDPEYLDLKAVYSTKALFIPETFSSFQMINRVRMKVWTGYDNTVNQGKKETEEQMVYITETGTVYHTSRDCSHLQLSVSQVDAGALDALRNQHGAKYYICELCGDLGMAEMAYITKEGNRYHTTLSCSGLKRTVITIPISEVGSRHACSRCGG